MVEIEVELVNETIEVEVELVNVVIGGVGGNATVENSDQSYSEEVAAGDTLVLPDISYTINVNGVLNQSFSAPAIQDLQINIQ